MTDRNHDEPNDDRSMDACRARFDNAQRIQDLAVLMGAEELIVLLCRMNTGVDLRKDKAAPPSAQGEQG